MSAPHLRPGTPARNLHHIAALLNAALRDVAPPHPPTPAPWTAPDRLTCTVTDRPATPTRQGTDMTLKQHACVTVACDVCGEQMQNDLVLHFDDLGDARNSAGGEEWFIAEDGRALCPEAWPTPETEHVEAAKAWLPTLSEDDRERLTAAYPSAAMDAPQPPAQVPGQQEIPAVRGYRIGDMVRITGRGEVLDGRTGPVAELDGDPEFGIGIKVEGFLGLVWCNSTEIRHLDAAEIAAAEAGAR